MKNGFSIASASAAFVATFCGRRDGGKMSAMGLQLLEEWKALPETKAVENANAVRPVASPRCILYCYQGTHSGEFFSIHGSRTTVGKKSTDGIVLTPTEANDKGTFEFRVGERIELLGAAPHPFQLNGRPEYRATLVDYDEVVLFGNRFLVLDLQGENS